MNSEHYLNDLNSKDMKTDFELFREEVHDSIEFSRGNLKRRRDSRITTRSVELWILAQFLDPLSHKTG